MMDRFYPGVSANDFQPKLDSSSKSELFEIAHEIEVLAPSHFPKPTRKYNNSVVIPIVEPTFGQHRREQDVVMVRENFVTFF
jgi:hypothetical protein